MKNKLKIENEQDIVKARNLIKQVAQSLGFGIFNQTRIMTAVSELTRNVLLYAEKGIISFEILKEREKQGIYISVKDKGPGIKDLHLALKKGYSTGKGLGLGLSGAKKLMDEFNLESSKKNGTKIEIIKWLS
ncbi:MAG: ATP-binding protein [archaeon]